MNKQQADFKPWDEGCVAIDTSSEWGVFYKDTKKELTIDRVVSNEETAVDVADKAIVRMILQ